MRGEADRERGNFCKNDLRKSADFDLNGQFACYSTNNCISNLFKVYIYIILLCLFIFILIFRVMLILSRCV